MEKIPIENTELSLEEINRFQTELIKDSNLPGLDWIERYSPIFREIINENEEIRALYRQDSESAIEQIKDLLSEKESSQQKAA